MRALSALLDAVSGFVGRLFAWLVLLMVVLTFTNVILRYGYGFVVPAMYQASTWAFGMVLTACAGYALLHNDHVRVDILYARLSERGKAAVDFFGCIFLLAPFLYVFWTRVFPYVERSWAAGEGSQEISGLPAVYILKSFLLVFVAVLAVQGLSLALKSLLVLCQESPTEQDSRRGGRDT